MLKIIDRYIIKTFFGPFLFIFSVLFFIFIVNIIWIQLSQFMGKGLSYWEIIKLLFYLGVSVISLVMPLTILLASIMTFGDLGERYELAALKASGTSLTRTMMPLFFVSILLSILLFFFSNNIIPDFQRKAKNMLYNIASTKPALNFTPGQFIDQIPGYLVKFDKVYGENATELEGIFIHKKAYAFENQQSILAKKGRFVPASNSNYLKLELYNGYVFEDMVSNQTVNSRRRQPDQAIKFDTLVSHFDISEILKKAIDDEKITDDYRFQTYNELNGTIAQTVKDSRQNFKNINTELVAQTNSYVEYIDKTKSKNKNQISPQFDLEKIEQQKKNEVLLAAYQKIETLKMTSESKKAEILPILKYYSKVIMYQQRIIAYSVTCVIFFLIGASLGSIIRKGGMGLPVIIAIVIFIIFYIMNLSVENIAWNGTINPYLAAWLPNMILLPFGSWLTYKALTDSQLFDIEKYRALFKPIISKFTKNKEHKRYQ
ncbi:MULTISPECIES: LptF/LptG family permease [Amniculibacterium]|uniref:LptF/LptG family permease n=1 Tax=Amniculibacterium TaxID=2715289 RepID=UPI000F59FCF5|nr:MULTISPECIES: LptF/LptG family permease [Amniculibacterium]